MTSPYKREEKKIDYSDWRNFYQLPEKIQEEIITKLPMLIATTLYAPELDDWTTYAKLYMERAYGIDGKLLDVIFQDEDFYDRFFDALFMAPNLEDQQRKPVSELFFDLVGGEIYDILEHKMYDRPPYSGFPTKAYGKFGYVFQNRKPSSVYSFSTEQKEIHSPHKH